MDRAEAVALLAAAPFVHLATSAPDGEPILRSLHGVVLPDALYFHGAPAGEKMDAIGRAAVVSADEIVAEIPSYFVDPERACPATTFYRSVQVHGVLEAVEEPAAKARALQALMERFQPEGGHLPITADHPLYASAVRGILIVRVSLERLDGKAKLGQNRSPEELQRVLELLWARGRAGDPRAIERVRAANPRSATPEFLVGPAGARMSCALDDAEAPAAAALLEDAYWNDGVPREKIARAMLGATAWVGAHDESGRLVATARALSDGAKVAWIFDVVVAPEQRGRGLGQAVMRLLLDHPAVRGVHRVRLQTRDAQPLYSKLGFVERARDDGRPEMILAR